MSNPLLIELAEFQELNARIVARQRAAIERLEALAEYAPAGYRADLHDVIAILTDQRKEPDGN